jgi:carbon starvation protein CstA
MNAAVLLEIAVVFFFLVYRLYAWFIAQVSGENDTTRCNADAFTDTERRRGDVNFLVETKSAPWP